MGTDNKQSEFEAHLDAFLASFKPTPEALKKREEANAQREEFIRRFPLDSIPNLTLEQYCIGTGKKDSFCWWIERGTRGYNYYFPGSSYTYGIYWSRSDGAFKKAKMVQDYIDEHDGMSDGEALRECILKPLHTFLSSGWQRPLMAKEVKLGTGLLLKLLNLYFAEDFFVMNSEKWIAKVLAAIGEDPTTNPYDGCRLIRQFFNRKKEQFPDSDFSQYDFEAFLERELNLKAKESTDEEVVEVETESKKETEMEAIHPLNTILYGPPGTGKTFNTVIYAVAIIEGKTVEAIQSEDYEGVRKRYDAFKKQGRIAFTTFHQSYGYEDFIEGIRPTLDGEKSEITYELHDGCFKRFCVNKETVGDQLSPNEPSSETVFDEALALFNGVQDQEENKNIDLEIIEKLRNSSGVIWSILHGGSCTSGNKAEKTANVEMHKDCFEDGIIRVGCGDDGRPDSGPDAILYDKFTDELSTGDIVLCCYNLKSIDGIGIVTGEAFDNEKYEGWRWSRMVEWLWHGDPIVITELLPPGQKQFPRQGTLQKTGIAVDDLVHFIKENLDVHDILKPMDDSQKILPYVFIIDEINRGNISKIFGELITLIEPNKRLGSDEEAKATLPYSGEEFGVPNNVYILGTMNTADRSIALLDTALRRRFDFVEMPPRPDLLEGIAIEGADINLETMLQKMNDRIEFLLDREHTIGHAYFMGDFEEHPTLDGLADIFRNKIVPLLQEYFFDDYSKIRLVLGDNAKSKDCQFVLEETSHASLFAGAPADMDLDKPTYKINSDAFGKQEAYIGIYA